MNTIYIDMDGVVADFDRAVAERLRPSPEDLAYAQEHNRWPKSVWQEIIKDSHFYRDLPKMPQADRMISTARRFRDELGWKLYMLTAIPKDNDIPDCIQDKILWMNQYYPDIPVRFGPYSQDKQNHAKPGDILVDDKPSNIEQWRSRGGIGIQVTKDYDVALLMLAKYFELA